MKYWLLSAAVLAAVSCSAPPSARAQSYNPSVVRFENRSWTDNTYRYAAPVHVVFTGTVIRVNEDSGRLAVRSDSSRRYNVDTFNAEVITPASNTSDDLVAGARVRVVGYRYGVGMVDADRVVILRQDVEPAPAPEPLVVAPPVVVPEPPVDANPAPPVHVHSDMMRLEGIITLIAPDSGKITVQGDDDGLLYDVKAGDADILLPLVDRAGTIADLQTGMRVRVVGEKGDDASIFADRIRVIREDAVLPSPAPAPDVVDLSVYTGILIDVRGFSKIQRSPSPAVYGPDGSLLYPDRTHVPTPDEVQDESVVRYYRTLDAAMAGVGGSHPLILQALSLEGPADDGVLLSAEDAALFKALDQRLGYSHTWKVGFLTPEDR